MSSNNENEFYCKNSWNKDTKHVADYDYNDADGTYLFTEQRGVNPQGEKAIQIIRWNQTSFGDRLTANDKKEFQNGIGDEPRVLYRLPELIAAGKQEELHIAEGPKDCDRLRNDFDVVATTNVFGAYSWCDEYAKYFRDRVVFVYVDNDAGGRTRETKIRRSLFGVAKSVFVVRFDDMSEGSDVSDFLDNGGNYQQLMARARNVTPVQQIKGDLARVIRETEQRLRDSAVDIFVRGGRLVQPVSEIDKSGRVSTYLKELTAHGMLRMLAEHVSFGKWSAKAGKLLPEDPTLEFSKLILNGDLAAFRVISGVITTPTLREDGSILSQPGYDQETGLYLLDPLEIGEVGGTEEAAREALKLLDGLLIDFPFVGEASRSVALSGLITPVVRALMKAAPLHAFTAPEPGSGKSYAGDLAGAIQFGASPSVIAWSATDEGAKRLDIELLSGVAMIVLDNVVDNLKGLHLCQAVERPEVKPRILGRSEAPKIPNTYTIFANGNALCIEADMVRRTILCQLDAQRERPEERVFKINPFAMILADRAAYVRAALTIVSAYIKEGRPRKVEPMNSFEGWSDNVRSALIWLGCADPVETKQFAMAEDPDKTILASIISGWTPACNGQTTAQLVKLIKEEGIDGPLQTAFAVVGKDFKGEYDTNRIGRYLSKNKNRVVGSRRIEQKKNRDGASVWSCSAIASTDIAIAAQ